MSTHREIRAAISAIMKSVPNIGTVHLYERYASTQSALLKFYGSGNKILGWNIRRLTKRELKQSTSNQQIEWEIRGFLSLNDEGATELVMDDYADAICNAINTNATLNETVDSIRVDAYNGARITESRPVMFAGVLCHSVKIRLETLSEKTSVDLTTLANFEVLHAESSLSDDPDVPKTITEITLEQDS